MKRLAILLLALACLGGCATRPQQAADLTPTATAMPNVDISGKLDTLDQKITQVQHTQSTQTSIYARDSEQAKTDRAKDVTAARTGRKYFGAVVAILAAFAVFGWCTEQVLSGWRRDIALVAAGGAICFAIVAVMVWPY